MLTSFVRRPAGATARQGWALAADAQLAPPPFVAVDTLPWNVCHHSPLSGIVPLRPERLEW